MERMLKPDAEIAIDLPVIVSLTAKEVDAEITDVGSNYSNNQHQYRGGYGQPTAHNNAVSQQTNFGNQAPGYYVYYPNEGNNAGRNPYGVNSGNPDRAPQSPSDPEYQYVNDEDGDDIFAPSFSTQSIRSAFIKKVYLILFIQLLCFGGIVSLFVFEPNFRKSARMNTFAYYIPSLIIFIISYFVLVCNSKLRRKVPINFVFLFIMTVALAMVGATISARYNTYVVMMSFGVVAAVCLLITAAAWINIFDMTKYRAYLFVASCVMLLLGIVYLIMSFFMRSQLFSIIYISIMTVLMAAYLMYDTQMIIGGKKHKYELSAEEYILGAVLLYVDIAYMFIYILMLMGMCHR